MDKKTLAIRKIVQLKELTGIHVPLVDESSPAFALLDQSGVLPHLARTYTSAQAAAVLKESPGVGWFLKGKSIYYLRSDIIRRMGSGRVCKAILDRVRQLDAQLGQACRVALLRDGSDGLFEVLDSHLNRKALADLAQRQRNDLATPEQALAVRQEKYGRAM